MKYADSSTQINDTTVRQMLIGYRVFLSVSSLIGDSLIIVGSLRYNAIKLNKILVILIQHMAVADLIQNIFGIIPGGVSLAANDWILGHAMCYLSYFFRDSSGVVICMLTTAMATTKMLVIKYPLRALNFSTRVGRLVVFNIWVAGCIFPAAAIAKDSESVQFGYLLYNCDYTCKDSAWNKTSYTIYTTAVGLFVLTTIGGTVVSSIVLLILARRATAGRPGGLKRGGVLTILLTAAAHTLLVLPAAVYYIITYLDRSQTNFYRVAWWTPQLVVVVNFYILGLTLPSFRAFLKGLVQCGSSSNGRGEDERQSLLSEDS